MQWCGIFWNLQQGRGGEIKKKGIDVKRRKGGSNNTRHYGGGGTKKSVTYYSNGAWRQRFCKIRYFE